MNQNEFNLITSGCGTGKSHLVIHNLMSHFPLVKPYEVVFLTSRSAIVRQQSLNESVTKFDRHDPFITAYWNDDYVEEEDDDIKVLPNYGISIMSYDKIIDILVNLNPQDGTVLKNAKIVVFDECHTLFCDLFIKDINTVVRWIRDRIDIGDKIIIGMTATAGIMKYHEYSGHGFKLNELNKEPLMAYKANQLICTDSASLPYLITKALSGRTIILCTTIKQCLSLQREIDNAAVLVSPHAKEFTSAMQEILDEITKNETLPNDFEYFDGTRRPLDVLICTSTLREGINLSVTSRIRNVISCFTDELHVIQFAGRCRFNIDCLVVADTFVRSDNYHQDPYLAMQRNAFRKYRDDRRSTRWFDSIAHIVSHDQAEVKWIYYHGDRDAFRNYIDSKWLVPSGITSKEKSAYRIFEKDHQEIIDKAVSLGVIKLPKSKQNFNKIVKLLEDEFGYVIESGQARQEDSKPSYKLIVACKNNVSNDISKENDVNRIDPV